MKEDSRPGMKMSDNRAGGRDRIEAAIEAMKERGRSFGPEGEGVSCMSRIRDDGVVIVPNLRQGNGCICGNRPKYAVGGEKGLIQIVCGHHDAPARRKVYQKNHGRYPKDDPGSGVVETVPLSDLFAGEC